MESETPILRHDGAASRGNRFDVQTAVSSPTQSG
jgi:hypothetical protein